MYQPVVRLETHQIVGFEALLRWHHPTLGLIMPNGFIPIAEESVSIVAIGEWVLHTASEMRTHWQRDYRRDPALTMTMNLSAHRLAADDVVEQVADAPGNTSPAHA